MCVSPISGVGTFTRAEWMCVCGCVCMFMWVSVCVLMLLLYKVIYHILRVRVGGVLGVEVVVVAGRRGMSSEYGRD